MYTVTVIEASSYHSNQHHELSINYYHFLLLLIGWTTEWRILNGTSDWLKKSINYFTIPRVLVRTLHEGV